MTGSCPVSARVCQETARERDEARAEVERLRAGIEALADKADDYGEPTLVNMANDLLNPTEGETDE